jgi:hypothetical protein
MKYFKLFENFVNEAKSEVKLKDLDLNKLDKIFDLLTSPLPGLEEIGYDSVSNEEPGSFKYVTKFLKKLAEAHAKGNDKFVNFIFNNADTFPSEVTVQDNVTDYLEDKKLAKQIQELNDAFYSMNYNLYNANDKVISAYNSLADLVAKFKI